MTPKSAVDKIHALPRFQGAPSLLPMKKLMALLHNPQEGLCFVHVAGTNGKGSTATMIASILGAAGKKVGLYTSPFINDFRERFRIQGNPVSPAVFVRAARRCFTAMQKLPEAAQLSQFDVVTAIAFLIFAQEACDVVVLECGLGGRYDATNVIPPPAAAVICNIGYDHMEVLGNTIEAITSEKCGILKSGTGAFVMAPQDYDAAVRTMDGYAAQQDLTPYRVSADAISIRQCTLGSLVFTYKGVPYRCALAAAYQAKNAATAIETVNALRAGGMVISDSAVASGLARAYIPARMELLAMRPHILLDGAHNADGLRALRDSAERIAGQFSRLFCLVGMLRSKEPQSALSVFFSSSLLREKLSGIVTVTPDSPRACPAEELAGFLRDILSDASAAPPPILSFPDVQDGLQAVLHDLRDNDALLCFGSLYMMGTLRRAVFRHYIHGAGGEAG